MLSLGGRGELPIACGFQALENRRSIQAIQSTAETELSVPAAARVTGNPLQCSGFIPSSTDGPLLLSTF